MSPTYCCGGKVGVTAIISLPASTRFAASTLGAQVWGGFESQPFAQDTTDGSGQFALAKAAAPPFVTVTADGYAADQQQFDPTNLPSSLVFRLTPVPPLHVRLVDEGGQGMSGVRLFLQEWWGRSGTLAQHLGGQSDADGRLQWRNC